jgi:hypothetical protein
LHPKKLDWEESEIQTYDAAIPKPNKIGTPNPIQISEQIEKFSK